MTLGLVHTPKVGTTQVGNLDFNSLCKLDDGVLLAANESGIHTLDTSGSDDGADIDEWFQFPRTAFGFLNQKRVKKLICSFEADGMQVIRVSTDEGTWVDRNLSPFLDAQKSEGMVVPIGRELKGGHFEIEWRNDNGSDFSVDAIDVMLTLLHSRAGRSRFFKPWLAEEFPMLVMIGGDWNSGLITNGDMELDSDWSDQGTPPINERSTEQVYAGSYSRKFTADSASDGIKSEPYSVEATKEYSFSLWVYPVDVNTVQVAIRRGTGIGGDYSNNFTGLTLGTWNYITDIYTAAQTGDLARFIVASAEGSGIRYVDNASLEEIVT